MKIVTFAVLTALSLPVFAQTTSTPRIDQRQSNQEQRIDKGSASGALTKRETRRLEKEQTLINKAEDKAKADGSVSAKERKRLTKMQNHASRDIYRQKHDAQTSGAAGK